MITIDELNAPVREEIEQILTFMCWTEDEIYRLLELITLVVEYNYCKAETVRLFPWFWAKRIEYTFNSMEFYVTLRGRELFFCIDGKTNIVKRVKASQQFSWSLARLYDNMNRGNLQKIQTIHI
jgi:hypothetical protein